ncbi:hypothetical protein FJ366_02795 [Candidatus Dependentiae bacterium]|nr:hypothetical protein [Candidatus Dependentiae bacterium]
MGFLQRVRNNSIYAIDFSQEKTLLDFLPEGTVIRIKSLRKEYGPTGRYYAVRRLVGAYRLQADTIDPEDTATHFVVKRYVARDFSEYMGLYSDSAEGLFLQTNDSRAATFSLQDIMSDTNASGHWSIVDASGEEKPDQKNFLDPQYASTVFNACYLKSRVSGFMQSRGTPQNYTGLKAPVSKSVNAVLSGNASSTRNTNNSNPTGTPQINQSGTGTSNGTSSTTPEKPKESPTALGSLKSLSTDRCIALCYLSSSNIFAIKQNGTPLRKKEDDSWEALDQGLNGAVLTSICGANDGSLWATDQSNNLWSFDVPSATWIRSPQTPATSSVVKIILSDASNVWVLGSDGALFQRTKTDESFVWKVPSFSLPDGGIKDISMTSDGTMFVISNDSKIYKGTRNNDSYSFSLFAHPANLVSEVPFTIASGSPTFVSFTTSKNEVYILVDGKSGSTKDSWKKLTQDDQTTPIKFRTIAGFKDKSLVGIVSNSGQSNDNTIMLVSNIKTT